MSHARCLINLDFLFPLPTHVRFRRLLSGSPVDQESEYSWVLRVWRLMVATCRFFLVVRRPPVAVLLLDLVRSWRPSSSSSLSDSDPVYSLIRASWLTWLMDILKRDRSLLDPDRCYPSVQGSIAIHRSLCWYPCDLVNSLNQMAIKFVETSCQNFWWKDVGACLLKRIALITGYYRTSPIKDVSFAQFNRATKIL